MNSTKQPTSCPYFPKNVQVAIMVAKLCMIIWKHFFPQKYGVRTRLEELLWHELLNRPHL